MNKLQTIIEYAIERGWTPPDMDKPKSIRIRSGDVVDFEYDDPFDNYRLQNYQIIYSHDFLKAVFGEELRSTVCLLYTSDAADE